MAGSGGSQNVRVECIGCQEQLNVEVDGDSVVWSHKTCSKEVGRNDQPLAGRSSWVACSACGMSDAIPLGWKRWRHPGCSEPGGDRPQKNPNYSRAAARAAGTRWTGEEWLGVIFIAGLLAFVGFACWRLYRYWVTDGPGFAIEMAIVFVASLGLAGVFLVAYTGAQRRGRKPPDWYGLIFLSGLIAAGLVVFGAFGGSGTKTPPQNVPPGRPSNYALCLQLNQLINSGEFFQAAQLEGLQTGQDPGQLAALTARYYNDYC